MARLLTPEAGACLLTAQPVCGIDRFAHWFGRSDVGGCMDEEASPTLSVQDVSRNRPERRERTVSWRTGIENQATRVQIAVDEIRSANRLLYERDGESDAAVKAHSNEPVLQRIENDVELALEITRSGAPRGVLGRLRDLWTGSSFEQALAAINRARETLLLVQPGPAVLARLPDLRAGVKDHLRVTDPRFDVFMRIIDAAERRAGLLSTEAKGDQKNRA